MPFLFKKNLQFVRQIEVNWISCHTGDALELRGWRVPFLKPAL